MSNTIAEKLNKLVLLTTRIKNQYGKTSLEDAVGEIEQAMFGVANKEDINNDGTTEETDRTE